jgi:HK97 family phage portal protein
MARLIQRLAAGWRVSAKAAKMFPSETSFMIAPGQPVWMRRDYARFAEEGYRRNVIAFRAASMIATAIATVPWQLYERGRSRTRLLEKHPLLALLKRPNPMQGDAAFIESVVTHKLIAGNSYIHAVGPKGAPPMELHALRPDRMVIIAGNGGVPKAYRYQTGTQQVDFPIDRITGQSRILHLKNFHPLDDWYGMSAVEAAAYSIDQHNQCSAWNQALLQNGARPSGALMVKGADGGAGHLTEPQYVRLKQQLDEQFSGAANAGRPLLLEGGLEWKEMSLSPKEMDFIGIKNSSARDIALAFGVPPQLLGIPGDNTYANLQEARLALWEQTILPGLQGLVDALNNWLAPMFSDALVLGYDAEAIPAMTIKRDALWQRVGGASFLSDDEKRRMLGLGAVEGSNA